MALDRGVQSASHPGCLTPEKQPPEPNWTF